MKLLLGSETYHPDVNGCSYFSQRLALGMQRRGHEVHVIYPSRRLNSTNISYCGAMLYGVPSISIPSFKRHFRVSLAPLYYRSLLDKVIQIRPDLIHIQDHFLIGRVLSQIAHDLSIPVIGTNHFIPANLTVHLSLPKPFIKKIDNLIWNDLVNMYNQLELITTPTQTAAKLIEEHGIITQIAVVSCGLDLDIFNPRIASEKNSRPTYLYVGRLEKEKRIDDLIQALPLVRESVDAQLIIVGIGKQHTKLVELAKKLHVSEYVTFTGFVKDTALPKIYNACDVFCIASIAELQSLATMEAMATGKPVISANVLALPHLVHHGFNGYVYEPSDVKTLSTYLIELLSDEKKRESMGQRSLEIVGQHNLYETLAIFERIYESVITNHKKR
jgi:glycosyltransferase involved in cell wall biosynthesis